MCEYLSEATGDETSIIGVNYGTEQDLFHSVVEV